MCIQTSGLEHRTEPDRTSHIWTRAFPLLSHSNIILFNFNRLPRPVLNRRAEVQIQTDCPQLDVRPKRAKLPPPPYPGLGLLPRPIALSDGSSGLRVSSSVRVRPQTPTMRGGAANHPQKPGEQSKHVRPGFETRWRIKNDTYTLTGGRIMAESASENTM